MFNFFKNIYLNFNFILNELKILDFNLKINLCLLFLIFSYFILKYLIINNKFYFMIRKIFISFFCSLLLTYDLNINTSMCVDIPEVLKVKEFYYSIVLSLIFIYTISNAAESFINKHEYLLGPATNKYQYYNDCNELISREYKLKILIENNMFKNNDFTLNYTNNPKDNIYISPDIIYNIKLYLNDSQLDKIDKNYILLSILKKSLCNYYFFDTIKSQQDFIEEIIKSKGIYSYKLQEIIKCHHDILVQRTSANIRELDPNFNIITVAEDVSIIVGYLFFSTVGFLIYGSNPISTKYFFNSCFNVFGFKFLILKNFLKI